MPVRVSWVRPENIHLTLRFLGEIDDSHVEKIAAHLRKHLAGVESFSLRVRGVGVFPSAKSPSVLWVGAEPLDGSLRLVQAATEAAAQTAGLKAEQRAFSPHLTLARVRDLVSVGSFSEILSQHRDFDGGEIRVESVALFSSTLTPHGAPYACIKEFPLA